MILYYILLHYILHTTYYILHAMHYILYAISYIPYTIYTATRASRSRARQMLHDRAPTRPEKRRQPWRPNVTCLFRGFLALAWTQSRFTVLSLLMVGMLSASVRRVWGSCLWGFRYSRGLEGSSLLRNHAGQDQSPSPPATWRAVVSTDRTMRWTSLSQAASPQSCLLRLHASKVFACLRGARK